MPDSFTHVTHQSYGSRVGNSCKGLIFGPILFVVAIALLVWNEGTAVAAHRSLEEAARATVSLTSADKEVDPQNEGKLIHLIGKADISMETPPLIDATFGVSPKSSVLKLRRNVEMYQWVETSHSQTKKNTGGSTTTTTTYSYSKEWRSSLVESSRFQHPEDHQNHGALAFEPFVVEAHPITFGKFVLSSVVTDRMNWYSRYPEATSTDTIPDESVRSMAHVADAGFYIGANPASPAIGDTKIKFDVVAAPQTVSIVAKQVGNSFESYSTSNGKRVLLVEHGSHSAEEMFEHAQANATTLAWILRLVGFIIMYCGLVSVIQPLSTVADVLPFLGNMVEGATSCIMFPVALSISSFIILLSWIAVRPFLVIPLLGLLAGGIYYFYRKRSSTGGVAAPVHTSIPVAQVVGYQDDMEAQTANVVSYK